jgi:hypothetical protein
MPSTRPRCITCSKILSSWGKTSSGKKRYGCATCKKTRIYQKNVKAAYAFNLFKQYVLWGLTYEMLSSFSGHSIQHLVRKFHNYLEQDPPELPLLDQSNIPQTFLLIDGLWFGRWFVLMVYRQSGNLTILHISSMGREAATRIEKDLKQIKEHYLFTGIVSDGGTEIVSAVNEVFPYAPHQICLAHLHRGIIAAIGRYSKDYRIQELKRIADHVWLIESKEALRWWMEKLNEWIKRNNSFLKEKRYDLNYNWWHTHKGARKAVATLLDLPKTSFKFLDYPLMPKTTNEIEAQFGHLGKRWLAHRGLKRQRWEYFLKWFVYFYNQEKLSQKKTKED